MKPILRALRLFSRERGLWRYALLPLAWGAGAFLVAVVAALALGERTGAALARAVGFSVEAGEVGGLAIAAVLTFAFGSAAFLGFVGLIGGFGFERLSEEVEARAFGRVAGKTIGFGARLGDGLARALLAAVLGLAGLCLSGTLVVPWLIASMLVFLDATAPALLRRDIGLGRQFGIARRLPDALPFAAVAGLVALVPVLNVLALPVLVAAGTLMVADDGSREPV